jgi:preprotein translocase subunit SecG
MHTRKFPGEKKRRERRTFKRKLTIPSTKDIICKSDINTSTNSMGKQRKKSDTGAAVVESFLEEMTMIHASMLFFCLFKNATPKRQQKKEKKKNQKKRQTETRLVSLTKTEFPKLRNKIRIRSTWLVAKQIVTETKRDRRGKTKSQQIFFKTTKPVESTEK